MALIFCRFRFIARDGRVEKGQSWPADIEIAVLFPLPVGIIGVRVKIPYMHAGNRALEERFIPPIKKIKIHREFLCEFRGVYECSLIDMYVEDIFGVFRLRRKLREASYSVSVSPKYILLKPLEGGIYDDGLQPARSYEDTSSYADIAPYAQGDSLRRVHWKLSLKRRELLVRQFETLVKQDMLLLIDMTPPEGLSTLRMRIEDLICDCAASIAHAQLSANHPVRMPLFAERNIMIQGQGSRDFHSFIEALTQVPFDGSIPMAEIIAKETRLFRGNHCVLVLSKLPADLSEQVLKLSGMVRMRVIGVFEDGHGYSVQVSSLREAGITTQIITPSLGLMELAKGERYDKI